MAYIWLLLSSICSVAASIALKIAAKVSLRYQAQGAFHLESAIPYLIAMALYGLGFFLYAVALKKLDLSLAYPLMVGISILGIVGYGVVSDAEIITISRIIGAIFVIIGIFLLNR